MKQLLKIIKQDVTQLVEAPSSDFSSAAKPNTLFFEVTNICNAKCIFCAYKTATHPKGTMSFDIFKRAIDEYVEWGGGIVSFTPTAGDPLIDPNLIEKIKYAISQPKIKNVYFYSNGILLENNELYKKLVDSGIKQINISTAGANKEMFERVYGVKLYDKVMKGINLLLSYNQSKGEPVEIEINFRQSSTEKEVLDSPDFEKYIKPYLSKQVTYSFMKDYDNWGGVIKQDELTGTMKLRSPHLLKRSPCVRMFDLMVLYEGSLRLCACRFQYNEFDELVVGNLSKETMRSVWHGEKSTALRKSFQNNTLAPVCKDCTLYIPALKAELSHHQNAGKD